MCAEETRIHDYLDECHVFVIDVKKIFEVEQSDSRLCSPYLAKEFSRIRQAKKALSSDSLGFCSE